VYEVGRNGAFDLGALTDKPDAESGQVDVYPMWWQYHPLIRGWVAALAWLATVLGVVLVLLLGARIQSFASDEWFEGARFRIQHTHRRWLAFVFVLFVACEALLGWRTYLDQRSNGAPFSLTEGNSIWPAEFLRLAAAALGIGFLVHSHFKSRAVLDRLGDRFHLNEPVAAHTPPATAPGNDPGRPPEIAAQKPPSFWKRYFYNIRVEALRYGDNPKLVDVQRLFAKYRELAATLNHYKRAGLRAALYFACYLCLFLIFGFPCVPARGMPWFHDCWLLSLRGVDFITMMIAVATSILLVFYVADATWLCALFVRLLQAERSHWPKPTRDEFADARGMLTNPDDVAEWIDIKIIARLTDIVGKLIYRPFILLFVLVAARNPWFAHWDWPLPLILVLSTSSLYVLYSGHVLRTTAERGRQRALTFLQERLSKALLRNDEKCSDQIRLIIEDVKSIQERAFAPWSQRPVLRAVLIPFGGTGLLQLLQYLATMR
jgi:hypothetical protein